MRTTTCAPVGFGSGTSSSCITSGPPNSFTRIAFMASPVLYGPERFTILEFHQRWRGLAREHRVNVVQSEHTHRGVRFQGGASDVRQQEGILQADVAGMNVRLALEDVQAGGGHA